MRILCVAEKPSIAKSISSILASGNGFNSRPGKDKYCRNFEFQYRFPPNNCFVPHGGDEWTSMVVTSVKGHLMGSDFTTAYRKWTACSPSELFTAPLETFVSKECEQVAQNLKVEARHADMLMIWTDCDREGEHIGTEVVKVCRQAKARLPVKRAKFSAIIASQIHHALQNPVELDWKAAEAVETRIELDLRLGAAFTRLQCFSLQNENSQLQQRVISYGPCQFPTLGFVVDRYIQARDFVPEPFWYIAVMDRRNEMEVDFRWSRNHLFDRAAVQTIYDRCCANREATVAKITSKQTRKFKPLPLTTVELQKSGGRLLRMTPKKVLDVAEKLYQRGILSYPRTETDQYDKDFDFHSLIDKQKADQQWGAFASRLTDADSRAFERPVNGKKNDKAHPPIHPTRHAKDLAGDEKRVYEYITRRFLASCNKHAVGQQTTIELEIAKEVFCANGVVVVEKNYLEVYTYDKWGGPDLPVYRQREQFVPTKMDMKEGETSRPKLLTEADLVSLMDKNGIGTDATIAEHISKIVEREYVKMLKEGQTNYLIPSELGMGLVEGYNAIEFHGNKSLCKPLLRKETEERMSLICDGTRTRQETVQQSLQEYKAVFDKTEQDIRKLIERVNANLRGEYVQGQANGHSRRLEDAAPPNEARGANHHSQDVISLRVQREDVVIVDEESDEDMITLDGPAPRPPTVASRPPFLSSNNTIAAPTSTSTSTSTSAHSSCPSNGRSSAISPERNSRPQDVTSRTSLAPSSSNRKSTASNKCYSCGDDGHWSKDCPSRSDSHGARDSGRTADECYKCGNRGHWASECTGQQQIGARLPKRSRIASGETATRGRAKAGRATTGSRSSTRGGRGRS